MSARLDDATAGRLAKILGLLGSDHVGERAAAAAKADALVRASGLTWRNVVQPSPPIAPQLEPPPGWRELAAECQARRRELSRQEREFIAAMVKWRGAASSKQLAWLTSIHARLHGAAARG